jgi:lipoate---protein ligase
VTTARGWTVEHRIGTAGSLCASWPRGLLRRERVVAFCEVTAPAVVIGSTQPLDLVDTAETARGGVEIARRRAGGGAVRLDPRAQVWIDFWLPRGDPLWHDDVVRSARWVGECWAQALSSIGAGELAIGPQGAKSYGDGCSWDTDEWARLICFAGVGPGEVTAHGAKVVGIAQRRDREGARFFTLAHMRWDPLSLVGLLNLGARVGADELAHLGAGARGLEDVIGKNSPDLDLSNVARAVEEAVAAQLP